MAGNDARPFVLLACLEPWLSALHGISPPSSWVSRQHTDVDGSLMVWFEGREMFGSDYERGSLQRVCEVLSLLALVARADVTAWKAMLLEIWPHKRGELQKLFDETLPEKFVAGFQLSEVASGLIDNVYNFHEAFDSAEPPSDEYVDVREFFKTELSTPSADADVGLSIRVRFEMECAYPSADAAGDMLHCAVHLIKTERRCRAKAQYPVGASISSPKGPRFTITNVDFTTAIGARLDEYALRGLHELQQLGISPSHLPAITMEPWTTELPKFVQDLRDLIGLDCEEGIPTENQNVVPMVSVNAEYSSIPVIHSLLTAVQHSSHVKTLEIEVGRNEVYDELLRRALLGLDNDDDSDDGDDGDDDGGDDDDDDENEDSVEEMGQRDNVDPSVTTVAWRDREEEHGDEDEQAEVNDQSDLWMWIAFTIFSRHANHNISTLELSAPQLQASEVQAIKQVLDAENPYAVVKGRTLVPPPSTPRQIVASRFTIKHPVMTKSKIEFMSKRPIPVRVLDEKSRLYEVLLPGHGDAWVRESDVISKTNCDLHLANRQATSLPGFHKIELGSMSDESMDSVAELLSLIGHDTQHIHCSEHEGDRAFEGWCERVLVGCPKLEHLDLGVFIDNLNVFEASARAGTCRLHVLSIFAAITGVEAEHVRAFFEALGDATHPLAGHLEQLSVGLIIETDDPQHVIQPVLRMLDVNRRLTKIAIRIMLGEDVEVLRSTFDLAFEDRKDDVVVIRTGPLDLRCKFAFLSTLQWNSGVSDSVCSRLDASVLSIVLGFAAEGCVRDCSIQCEKFPRHHA